jgi:ATP-dependent Zn protease
MENDIKCPYCAEVIKSEAKICKHCNKDLNTKEGKKLVKIEVEKIKVKELNNSLEKKLKKYPDRIRKKITKDIKLLEKLKNMNDEDIEKDIFNRERKRSIIILWIITLVFPYIILLTIWLHPSKDEKVLLKNRIKNFKKHKIRAVLSIIIIFFFYM